jgi:Asp-tRNA(Asn)/Glu-tRNA(Gln) amidotransferase A subunit family amidase
MVEPENWTRQEGLGAILAAVASASFDEPTRSGEIRRVVENGWPAYFRASRFLPAVEYVQAERLRRRLGDAYAEEFADVNLVIAPDNSPATIYPSNLVGYSQLLLPFGTDADGRERSVSFLGRPLSEPILIAAAHLVQTRMRFDRLRPKLGP